MYTELKTDDRFPQMMCISSYAAEDGLQPPLRLTVSTPNVIAPGDAPEKTCIESLAVSVQQFSSGPQWASPIREQHWRRHGTPDGMSSCVLASAINAGTCQATEV